MKQCYGMVRRQTDCSALSDRLGSSKGISSGALQDSKELYACWLTIGTDIVLVVRSCRHTNNFRNLDNTSISHIGDAAKAVLRLSTCGCWPAAPLLYSPEISFLAGNTNR